MTSRTEAVSIIKQQEYLAQISDLFVSRKCTKNQLSAQDRNLIQAWFSSGIPAEAVQAAILLGCCRKYRSWLENGERSRINSLRYFIPLLMEVEEVFQSNYYQGYLARKIAEFERELK